MENKHKVFNGTYYHKDTSDRIINALEDAMKNNTRITVDYGDVKTGKSWEEDHNITGYVGRSTGKFKIPLLIHNSRSMGGVSLLDHYILSIRHANKKNGGTIATA